MPTEYLPLLILLPAAGLYFFYKLTVPDLATSGDWLSLMRDGIASGVAFLGTGLSFFVVYQNSWLHWLGLGMAVWSLTYWASAWISFKNLQAQKSGKKINSPFAPKPPPPQPNRQQRRRKN
ncbi:MAG: hypothetical protein H7Y37_13915 [Anaerolineae bacterium]|nr:hypothetical protein [Gloeobacterales cyanobacterium ES-bin-313]